MTVAEIIRPGDKVDIRFAQSVERMKKDSEPVKIYKSKVLDFTKNGNIEMLMPSEAGKLVLLPLGVRLELVFFSRGGLYRAIGQIRERYKRENIYMLAVELKSQPAKYQRREFFRLPCILDMSYFTVTKEETEISSGEALFIQLREEEGENKKREYNGRIVDLSGGGLRFHTDQELSEHQYLLFEIYLENESISRQYYIIGNVISCAKTGKIPEKPYEVRAKFLIHDNSIREEIIRYVFEEDRKSRQRGR